MTAGRRRQARCQPADVRLQDRCSAMETGEEAALAGELAEPKPLSAPGGGGDHGRRLPPVGWRLTSSCALLPRDGRAQKGRCAGKGQEAADADCNTGKSSD